MVTSQCQSVRGDPAGPHEELEDDLAVVLVQPHRVEWLGRLPLLLLQVVGQQARLVAHVVRRRQLQVHAQLLLVERQQLVPRQAGDRQELIWGGGFSFSPTSGLGAFHIGRPHRRWGQKSPDLRTKTIQRFLSTCSPCFVMFFYESCEGLQ